MEGKPRTQTLFQRDPTKDTLERTLVQSKYLKTLQTFTGASKDRMEAEITTRKTFLDKLSKQNIRDLAEVAIKAKDFNLERKAVGEN